MQYLQWLNEVNRMKIARLVIGIISLILTVIIGFQSCAAGVVNAMQDNGQSSGTVGFFTGFMIMIAGIIAICARSSKPGGFVAGGFYIFAFLIGIANYGNYSDLAVWSVVSLLFAGFFIVSSAVMKTLPKTSQQSQMPSSVPVQQPSSDLPNDPTQTPLQ